MNKVNKLYTTVPNTEDGMAYKLKNDIDEDDVYLMYVVVGDDIHCVDLQCHIFRDLAQYGRYDNYENFRTFFVESWCHYNGVVMGETSVFESRY